MSRLSSVFVLLSIVIATACGGHIATAPAPEGEATIAEDTAPSSLPTPDVVHTVEPSPRLSEVLAAEDRSEGDRALDAQRRPGEVLTFFGVEEGQRVADLFAGTGYTTELLARTVGSEGEVIAQNNAFVLERFARGPLSERLARPGLEHVRSVEQEMDAPLPPGTEGLDAVIFILAYHDTSWMETDRAAMNRAVFEALRPGGVYGIVDHSAADGSGERDVRTLHRIEEALLIREVLAAGFELEASLEVLRNPEDRRDWNASPSAAGDRRGTSDRFVLRFVRPE